MRINKYIAASGVASRRKADELIANGNVRVNGKTMKELGYNVATEDKVEVNGKEIMPVAKKSYYILNKPLGYITSVTDDKGRPTVVELINDGELSSLEGKPRLFPVGRLDYNTTGLLILTDDGDLAYRITHPKHNIPKTYRVLVSGELSRERQAKLRKGIDIGGFVTSRAEVKVIKAVHNTTLVDITIHEGKNRQVRKMFSAIGNPVQALERTAIGDIKLGRLSVGHYRKITKEELEYLKSL